MASSVPSATATLTAQRDVVITRVFDAPSGTVTVATGTLVRAQQLAAAAADTTASHQGVMSRLIVHSFTISFDGYGAGPNQTKKTPLGEGVEELHEWLVGTRFFMQMTGREGGATGIDNDFAEHGMANIGAFIPGRNMFGPIRGPWPDESWRGWWGKNPPYHTPTFVLTHHPRAPQEMEVGTVFHFVTDGIHAALDRARSAAGDKDIRLLGGAATIRRYLEACLVDEMHIAVRPSTKSPVSDQPRAA